MYQFSIKNTKLTVNKILLLVCAYITFVFNYNFFHKTLDAIVSLDEYNIIFLCSVPVFVFFLIVFLVSIFSSFVFLKPFLVFLILVSSFLFYVTNTYGVVFDYGMVQNSFETDRAELFSYINLYVILFVFTLGVLPAIGISLVNITRKSLLLELVQRLKLIFFSLSVMLVIAHLYYPNYASVGRNNRDLVNYIVPFKFLEASYKYSLNNYFSPPLGFEIIDTLPSLYNSEHKKSVTVLVVGETARAKNFSLNGYKKNTNKHTDSYDVISYPDMSSCGTATAVSVPCMFSNLDKVNYNKRIAVSQQNLLDIVQLAGVDVLWIENNSSCKGVCTRVKTIYIDTDAEYFNCDGEYCFDEALLIPLKNKLTHLVNENTLVVLHMIGSHGPTYYRRYPSKLAQFLPDCPRSDFQNCTVLELMNTYDNTIAYTDYVLAKVIEELQALSSNQGIATSMLYVSDHGESLGEKGVYLHGFPYAFAPKEQTHIPMIFWADYDHNNIDSSCLKSQSAQSFSHDNIFDSMLGLLSVKSKVYDESMDLFSQCKVETREIIVDL